MFARRPAWQRRAACRGKGAATSWFDGSPEALEAARAVCEGCSVRTECLQFALDDRTIVGCWGGTTDAERRRMRKVSA
jgi:WhiB family redox-sensing transcriptional regulator